ncbi:MAG: hypothetical protein H8D46_04070 [FCB group bacterium]|nr:hypothetical protein [FCB group bacterium]
MRINDPRLGLEYNCQYSKDAESLTIMRTFNRKKYFLPQQYHMDVRETMIRLNDKDDTSIIFVRSE